MRIMTREHLVKRNADEIGAEIRRLRKASNNMRQEELAEKLGIEATAISKIEHGKKSNLTIDLLQDIADVFGITVNDICYKCDCVENVNAGCDEGETALEAYEIIKTLPEAQQEFLLKMIRGAAATC